MNFLNLWTRVQSPWLFWSIFSGPLKTRIGTVLSIIRGSLILSVDPYPDSHFESIMILFSVILYWNLKLSKPLVPVCVSLWMYEVYIKTSNHPVYEGVLDHEATKTGAKDFWFTTDRWANKSTEHTVSYGKSYLFWRLNRWYFYLVYIQVRVLMLVH